ELVVHKRYHPAEPLCDDRAARMTNDVDPWASWVLQTPASGVPWLQQVRERLLDAAGVDKRTTLLDLGTGEGLVAEGALARGASVVFTDVSTALLQHCERRLLGMAGRERVRFLQAAAEDLSAVANASVDVVTCRSVLVYS